MPCPMTDEYTAILPGFTASATILEEENHLIQSRDMKKKRFTHSIILKRHLNPEITEERRV